MPPNVGREGERADHLTTPTAHSAQLLSNLTRIYTSLLHGVVRARLGRFSGREIYFQQSNDHFLLYKAPQCGRYFT